MLRQQHTIKKRPDPNAVKKLGFWSPFKKILVGIPKNLIRIAMIIVGVSFVYMVYLLNNEQYTLDFLTAENVERDFESQTKVHPLF
jgi:hypothetical protein